MNKHLNIALYSGLLMLSVLYQPSSTLVSAQGTVAPVPTPVGATQELTCSGLEVEAEDGLLFGDFVPVQDGFASNGRYIHVPALPQEATEPQDDVPIRDDDSNLGSPNNYVEFCFRVSEAGLYRLRGLVYATNGLDNSFLLTVGDNQNEPYLWVLPVNNSDAHTFRLDYATANDTRVPLEVELPVGDHVIRITEREAGARLDKLILELIGENSAPSVSHPGDQRGYVGQSVELTVYATDTDADTIEFSAAGLPAGLTINPSTGVISGTLAQESDEPIQIIIYADDGTSFSTVEMTWEVTAESTVACGGLAQEAEDGSLFRKMVVVNDALASGGAYITNPTPIVEGANAVRNGVRSANLFTADSIDRKHRADFCVNVPWNGKYRLRAQVYAPQYFQNSFVVQVDSQPANGYTWDILPISSAYATDYLSQRGGADPVILDLTQGIHTISFISRENSTRLDSFVIEPIEVSLVETATPTEEEINQNLAQEAIDRGNRFSVFTPLIAP